MGHEWKDFTALKNVVSVVTLSLFSLIQFDLALLFFTVQSKFEDFIETPPITRPCLHFITLLKFNCFSEIYFTDNILLIVCFYERILILSKSGFSSHENTVGTIMKLMSGGYVPDKVLCVAFHKYFRPICFKRQTPF